VSRNKVFRCEYFSMHFRIKFLLFNDFPLYITKYDYCQCPAFCQQPGTTYQVTQNSPSADNTGGRATTRCQFICSSYTHTHTHTHTHTKCENSCYIVMNLRSCCHSVPQYDKKCCCLFYHVEPVPAPAVRKTGTEYCDAK
jgi:hypothetical protein